ncbi:MAG: hypothetical protein HFH87_10680 [Lachnospiraceae bacterium]|nr:hypothetical protein [Lachnospiraceae bacterium]
MKLLIFIVLLTFVFVTSVLIVQFCKGCSVKDATIICKNCVRNFLGELLTALLEPAPALPQFYPVLVGWDGCRVQTQFVDAEFSAVRANFASCYCTRVNYDESSSCVTYVFDVMRKPGSTLDDNILRQLIQKQSEEILANTMRTYDCYIPAEPLTEVFLFRNMLSITFARNTAGVELLDKRKQKMQKRKALSQRPENTPMRENWEDSDGRH